MDQEERTPLDYINESYGLCPQEDTSEIKMGFYTIRLPEGEYYFDTLENGVETSFKDEARQFNSFNEAKDKAKEIGATVIEKTICYKI